MKSGKLAIPPGLVCQYNENTLVDLLSSVIQGTNSFMWSHFTCTVLVLLYDGKIVKCSVLKEDINLNNPKIPILEKKMASMEVDYAKATKLLENAA